MDYQILVLDLDGTLTNRDKIITPKTKQALMELQKQGKKVVLASGRPTHGILPLSEELELKTYGGYILSFNGGLIQNCKTGETVFSRHIPVEANAAIVDLAIDERVNILTYEGDRILTLDAACPYVEKEAFINKLEVVQVEKMQTYVNFPVPKFLMLDDGDYLALVEARVKARLGKPFSIYRSEPYFLEIMPKGIDKAQSLERLLETIGLGREQMIACGDGYNDLTMIRYAGLGVAMENAILPLKNVADYITLSNNDDGIAHVVEKFMLS